MEGKIASHTPHHASQIAHDTQQVGQQALQLAFALDSLPPISAASEVMIEYPLRQFLGALKKFAVVLEGLAEQFATLPTYEEYEKIIAQQQDDIFYLQQLLQEGAAAQAGSLSLAMEG